MAKVTFSASGFETTVRRFKTEGEARSFIEMDTAQIAAEYGAEISDYGNGEWVAARADGEEIARWELG